MSMRHCANIKIREIMGLLDDDDAGKARSGEDKSW